MVYIGGLILFLGIHLVPVQTKLREALVAKLGALPYRGVFALLSFAGLGMIVMGWGAFPNTYFYEPSPGFKHINFLIMLPAIYLLTAAYVPNNLRRKIRHPMLTGVKIWALGHLLVNGDLRSMLLFGSFLAYCVIDMISANKRSAFRPKPKVSWVWDVVTVVVALAAYGAIAKFHGALFGMPILPGS